jgi:hypothetical protein
MNGLPSDAVDRIYTEVIECTVKHPREILSYTEAQCATRSCIVRVCRLFRQYGDAHSDQMRERLNTLAQTWGRDRRWEGTGSDMSMSDMDLPFRSCPDCFYLDNDPDGNPDQHPEGPVPDVPDEHECFVSAGCSWIALDLIRLCSLPTLRFLLVARFYDPLVNQIYDQFQNQGCNEFTNAIDLFAFRSNSLEHDHETHVASYACSELLASVPGLPGPREDVYMGIHYIHIDDNLPPDGIYTLY